MVEFGSVIGFLYGERILNKMFLVEMKRTCRLTKVVNRP